VGEFGECDADAVVSTDTDGVLVVPAA